MRTLLEELVELAHAFRAVPHLIRRVAILERRLECLEARTGELYSGLPVDAEAQP